MRGRLKPPDPNLDFADFPAEETVTPTTLFRTHETGFTNPWFYASHPDGRFNLSYPSGTCYAADDRETALLEVLRDSYSGGRTVEKSVIDRFSVTEVTIDKDFLAAALADPDARHFGALRSLSTDEDYTITQAWAERLYAENFDGIHYQSGYSSGTDANAWAIFGLAGDDPSGEYGATTLAVDALLELGYTIIDDSAGIITGDSDEALTVLKHPPGK